MTENHSEALAPGLVDLLNGGDLERKVGHTFLLVVGGADGWPRMAMLSVGEVVAVSAKEIRLALYRGTRTTRALAASGKGLLIVVHEGTVYKIALAATPVPDDGEGTNVMFIADVGSEERDVVGYATVEHGIEFSLVDEEAVVERWRRTTDQLRKLRP